MVEKKVDFKQDIRNILDLMKNHPYCYLMFGLPSLLVIIALSYIFSFDITQLYSLERIYLVIFYFVIFSITFLIIDSFSTHYTYTQYKHLDYSASKVFVKAIKNFHIFLSNRILFFLMVFTPTFLACLYIFSVIPYLADLNSSMGYQILLLISGLVLLLVSLACNIYVILCYPYLSVSTHFSKTKSLFKIKEHKKVVKSRKKMIIVKVLILFVILIIFNFFKLLYDILSTMVPQSIVSLIFQIIGVLIAMTFSYFAATYLFYTYDKYISK